MVISHFGHLPQKYNVLDFVPWQYPILYCFWTWHHGNTVCFGQYHGHLPQKYSGYGFSTMVIPCCIYIYIYFFLAQHHGHIISCIVDVVIFICFIFFLHATWFLKNIHTRGTQMICQTVPSNNLIHHYTVLLSCQGLVEDEWYQFVVS